MSAPRPHRILFVHSTQGRRLTGGPRMAHALMTGLDRERFEPHFVTQRSSELSESLASAGIPVRIVPLPRSLDVYGLVLTRPGPVRALAAAWGVLAYNRRMSDVLREVHPDLVWVNNLRAFFTVFLAASWRRVPIVWNIWLGQRSRGLVRLMNSLALLVSRRVVTEYRSQAAAIFTEAQLARSAGKIRTVYTGHPLPPEPALRGSGPGGARPLVVGNLGAFSPRKGQHVLLETARLLRGEPEAFRYLLGGEAASEEFEDYARRLRERCRENGLDDAVTWCGWVSSPFDFLRKIDVYVQTSSDEGLPGAVREAMMAGIPVVATDVGGTGEIVVEGETGLLVEPGNPGDLATALRWLRAHPEEARCMGVEGRRRAERLFSRDSFVRDYQEVLEEVLLEA